MEKFEIHGGTRTWDEEVCFYQFEKNIRITNCNNKFGLVDDDEILPPIYSSITFLAMTESIIWFKVAKNDKYGIIQCDLKESKFIIDIEYDSIEKEIFEEKTYEKFLFIVKITRNDLHGIYRIGSTNNIQWYDKVLNKHFFFLVEKDGLKGACNQFGDLCVPCLYDEIKFAEPHFLYLEKNNHIETYSFEKNELTPLNYDKVEVSLQGVKIYLNNHVGVYREGKEVCPPIYDDVEFGEHHDIITKMGELFGVVTASGSIIEPNFEKLSYLDSNHYAFLQNDKWGVVNNENHITSPKYDDIYIDNIYSKNIYGRIGRKMYNISENEKFIKIFLYNFSCGYENSNSPILKFDSKNIDLLTF